MQFFYANVPLKEVDNGRRRQARLVAEAQRYLVVAVRGFSLAVLS